MNLMRLLHTTRHLRGQQIVGQIAHRSRQVLENPSRPLAWNSGPFPGCIWQLRGEFLPPLQNQRAALMQAGQMEFLHQPASIGWPPDWNRNDLPRLWRYNLQYFDYLWELNYQDAKGLVWDWIEKHLPARGRVGWEPYPTSLRLINWCCAFFGKFRQELETDRSEWRQKLWSSVYRQARWLTAHLETHLLGNHLLENAAAMTVVGSCFAGDAATRWYERGFGLLRQQLAEQILEDGGHFERSPMYHSRAVYVLLMLRNLGRPELDEILSQSLARAIEALKMMCHPDGRIALLNDSAFGIYNEPAELIRSAGKDDSTAIGSFALPQTGYYGARTRDGSYVICDAAPIGPGYQPGHAHGDMLSFELSLRGQRVIVDSGVHDYEIGSMRDYCRSTRAHNTVEIDGQDQAEFWGAFRVARRGRVLDVKWLSCDDGFELSALHDGFARLPGKPVHHRTFRWHDRGELFVKDLLSSAAEHRVVSRIHLHPDCRIVEMSDKQARVSFAKGELAIEFEGTAQAVSEDSHYCPEFGLRLRNQAIAWSGRLAGQTEWSMRIRLM